MRWPAAVPLRETDIVVAVAATSPCAEALHCITNPSHLLHGGSPMVSSSFGSERAAERRELHR
jgi:hypothetical protein